MHGAQTFAAASIGDIHAWTPFRTILLSDCLVGSTAAMGVGVNLTVSSQAIFAEFDLDSRRFEPGENPGCIASGRATRSCNTWLSPAQLTKRSSRPCMRKCVLSR